MKRILMMCFMLIIAFMMVGCNNENLQDDITIVDSYESADKIKPTTIFSIEFKNEYLLEEEFIVNVKYGHLHMLNSEEKYEDNVALLLIHNFADNEEHYLTDEELLVGEKLLEVKNFYTNEYTVNYENVDGEYKNLTYNKDVNIKIPKSIFSEKTGTIRLTFVRLFLDENERLMTNDMDGSVIYLSYEIKDDKIYLKK